MMGKIQIPNRRIIYCLLLDSTFRLFFIKKFEVSGVQMVLNMFNKLYNDNIMTKSTRSHINHKSLAMFNKGVKNKSYNKCQVLNMANKL